jgi:DNA repair protein RadA/Sms
LTDSETASKKPTGLAHLDRLLQGGLVDGSVTLIGGEPGIGKSTILAEAGVALASRGSSVLYVTGEESPSQVLLRLKRLSPTLPSTLAFLDSMDAAVIAATILETKPTLTIVDSVQTLRVTDLPGEPGNTTQVKAGSAVIAEAAKQSCCAVVLVGQVTKDGDLAGPRMLEHLVDTVMMLEGDRLQAFRILRVLKHRFGPTDECAVLRMTEKGLEEVADPSAALIGDRPQNVSGVAVTCLMQGSRPLLVEIQALVTHAGYATPTRRASGFDTNRLGLLLAVLGRRAGVSFSDQDVFVNVVGGIEVRDPSADLALALALVSAKLNKPLFPQVVAWGEIGLAGEIRPVAMEDRRVKESERLGLKPLNGPKTIEEALLQVGCRP